MIWISLPIDVALVWAHYKYGVHTWPIDVLAAITSVGVAFVMIRKRKERAQGMGKFDAVLEPVFPAVVVYPPTFMVAMEHSGIISYIIAGGTIFFIIGTLATPLEFMKTHKTQHKIH